MIIRGIAVTNESDVPCDVRALARLAEFLLDALRLHPACELGITLVDTERMSTLNEDWMNEAGPTDVLSFPIDELRSAGVVDVPVPGVLGDIVLCPEVARAQSAAASRTLDEELQFLVIHGTLHLIGHDHATQEDYDAMFALQDSLLNGWHDA